jgi:ABC-type molybdenum transport system ATPase subunit/photorepair protein PhrA
MGNGVDIACDPFLLKRTQLVDDIAERVGDCSSVLIRSPPGSGKTSLLQLVSSKLQKANWRVRWAACSREGERDQPSEFLPKATLGFYKYETFQELLQDCEVRTHIRFLSLCQAAELA